MWFGPAGYGFSGTRKEDCGWTESQAWPQFDAAGGEGTDVCQTYQCSQVKPLCSDQARTSFNVLAHVSQRLKWAVLIKYCPLSIVINVLWSHTVFLNQRILPLTVTIMFWVKEDKIYSIER